MRAAVYARYSSDNQRDASIEDQVRLCSERAVREQWEIVQTYADFAVSGATLIRPGIQSLISDANAAKFDVILAESLDRISRDQEDVAGLFKRMAFAGIKIVTLSEGEVSELHIGLKGTMGALYLKDLADKTRRGLRGRVSSGKSGGGNAYGYDVLRKLDADGNAVRGNRTINVSEAAVVRRIFEAFAAGQSPRSIARDLNAERVPGPGGRIWQDTTIRGHAKRANGILYNELYIGRIVWNRQRFVKDPETGKRVSRANPPDAGVTQEVPELRIIDQALWERVKARQAASSRTASGDKTAFWDRRRPRYLFSGLIKCGDCGGGMSVVSRTHVGCSGARNKGSCANRRTMKREELEHRVLDGLKSRLMRPELFHVFCEEWARHLNEIHHAKSAHLAAQRTELERTQRGIRRIVEAVRDGYRTPEMKSELIELEARKAQLQRELSSAEEPVVLFHPNMAKEYRRRVRGLIAALNAANDRAAAANLLRGLVDRIVLCPTPDGYDVEIVGDLAGILSLANAESGKKPLENKSLELKQLKVVAGARTRRQQQGLFQAAA